jgi:hypothetical protein
LISARARGKIFDVETYRSARNLETPHPLEAYPGICVFAVASWTHSLIVAEAGQSFVARGGERALAYETPQGGRAEGFELRLGDRVTMVRSDLPFYLAEWQIERARA